MATYKTIHQILIEKVPGGAQLALPELIEKGRPYIFNFNYDIVTTGQAAEDYKKYFETEFLIRYFNREISRSDFDLWDLKLYGTLNNIMPYYNELIKSEEWFSKYIDNPANNTDYKEEYTRDITSNTTDKNTSTNTSKNKTKTEANTNTATKDKVSTSTIADAKTNDKTTSTNEGEQSTTNNTGAVGSQFPQSMLDTLADYATEASKTDSTVQGTSNSKTEQANNTKTSSSSNETNESENTTNTYESGTIGTNGTIQSESENNSDGKSKETYTFRRYGNIGVQTPGEVFESTRKAFINTLEMILTDKRIRDLFLQVPTNDEFELGEEW